MSWQLCYGNEQDAQEDASSPASPRTGPREKGWTRVEKALRNLFCVSSDLLPRRWTDHVRWMLWGCDWCPGPTLHPFPSSPSLWVLTARLEQLAAQTLSFLSYSATRWQVRGGGQGGAWPSVLGPFPLPQPPAAQSFPPLELFVPTQSLRSDASLIPPSQVSCGHTPVLAHADPGCGGGGALGRAGVTDYPRAESLAAPGG